MVIGLIIPTGNGAAAWMASEAIYETGCLSEPGEDPSAEGFLWIVSISEQIVMVIRVIKDKKVSVTWARLSSSVVKLEPS
jgi:hypothetical protein